MISERVQKLQVRILNIELERTIEHAGRKIQIAFAQGLHPARRNTLGLGRRFDIRRGNTGVSVFPTEGFAAREQ